jgi:hypothetical protein
MIDQSLITAYQQAKYMVTFENTEYRIKVGKPCQFVDQMLYKLNINTAYFITPENPFSCSLSDEENKLRHKRFCDEIEKHQYFSLVGYGTDEEDSWPKEISYLIFTNDDASMHNFATRFGQNAFLKLPHQQTVQLLVLESNAFYKEFK